MEFFTATCLYWQFLLAPDGHKQIIVDSLKFLVDDNRIWLYSFVIMPNHIHFMWRKKEAWTKKNIQQMFLKYTAQQIKFRLKENNDPELENYRSTQKDREYQFWERRAWKARLYTRKVAEQKLNYIHYNPVKAGLCEKPEDYKYSSSKYYVLRQDEWGFITDYREHLNR